MIFRHTIGKLVNLRIERANALTLTTADCPPKQANNF